MRPLWVRAIALHYRARQARSVQRLLVSDNFFSGLGVRPFLGRILSAEDEKAEAGQALVISYRCWEQQFDRNPNVVGEPVTLKNID